MSLLTKIEPVLHTWTATAIGVVLAIAGTVQQYGPGVLAALPAEDQKIGGALITLAGIVLTIAGRGPFSAPSKGTTP